MKKPSNKKQSWKSMQAIIISILILLIFSYMILDITTIKPQISKQLYDVQQKYDTLSIKIQTKFPEIQQQLLEQSKQISSQKTAIESLQKIVKTQTNF